MPGFDFDLLVIGAGSGGVRAARIAASHGAKVAICEESRVGGTCVIRGCVPKKLLAYAAHFSEEFEDAAGFGWTVGERSFSWPALIAAKDKEIDRLNQVYLKLLSNSGVTLFESRGSFIDNHKVQVGDRVVSAERILIASGAHPWLPDIPGIEFAISSDEAFYLTDLPQRIVIIGGGYIACEFAGIFNGLGSEVTQLYRGDEVLRGFDHDVRRVLSAEMAGKGVNFAFERNINAISKHGNELHCELDDGKILIVDQVMYATGRVPNVRNLGLEHTEVEVHASGWIVVDEYSRTSVEHIWAVGDVTSRVNLTPVAIYEGHAFADTEFAGKNRPVSHEYIPSAVFSQPPVGSVGFSEHDAGTHFGDLDIYRSEFRPMKHTMTGRAEKSMMKLIVARDTQRVVGLHMVGTDAPEIVQGFAVAVKFGLTKAQFDETIGIHPTAAEELVTMRHPLAAG
ncbi:MAG: glutathione-disulfide reductase [Xanthomonadales bacterium]|nr:glutathione-disulfide reductase [Xanthomonadales bacterium]